MTNNTEFSSLAELFNLAPHEAVAIIGSGGKTTLLWYLAGQCRSEKILVTPTTKIFLPPRKKRAPGPHHAQPAQNTGQDLRNRAGTEEREAGQDKQYEENRENGQEAQGALDRPTGQIEQGRQTEQPGQPAGSSTIAAPKTARPMTCDSLPRALRYAEVLYYDRLYGVEAFSRLSSAEAGITLAGQCDFTMEREALKNENRSQVNNLAPTQENLPAQAPAVQRRPVPNPERFACKIRALPPDILASQKNLFDTVFMECDGSRNLPLKGWAPYEPAIPDFTTMTIAVIPLWIVGAKAGDHCIHRAGLFYAMAQCQPGDTISLDHLARVIGHSRGLLAKTKGKTVLLLHLHNRGQLSLAKELLLLLPQETVAACDRIMAGSAQEGWGAVLHVK